MQIEEYVVTVVTLFGDAFHNHHHAVPNAVSFGVSWYEIDVVFILYLLLERFGLVFGHKEHPPMEHWLKSSPEHFGEMFGLAISVALLICVYVFQSSLLMGSRRGKKAKVGSCWKSICPPVARCWRRISKRRGLTSSSS